MYKLLYINIYICERNKFISKLKIIIFNYASPKKSGGHRCSQSNIESFVFKYLVGDFTRTYGYLTEFLTYVSLINNDRLVSGDIIPKATRAQPHYRQRFVSISDGVLFSATHTLV